jgi:hypothetical protein
LQLSGTTLTLDSSAGDNLYLTVSGGLVQWSSTGDSGSYSTDLDSSTSGTQTLAVGSGVSIMVQAASGADLGTIGFQDFAADGADLTVDLSNASATVDLQNVSTSGGDLTVTSKNVTIEGDVLTAGGALTLTASTIDVASGVTVSTRQISGSDQSIGTSTGDSGSLSFQASQITVSSGASVLTHVESGGAFVAGSLTLEATDGLTSSESLAQLLSIGGDWTATSATISLTGATIKGGTVSISASADSADLWDDDDSSLGEETAEFSSELFGSYSLIGGAAISKATATVTVSGGSITAETLSFDAFADTDAEITTITFYVGVAYGKSAPTATVTIQDGAAITTTGDLTITTDAESQLAVAAKQSLVGVSTTVEKYNITVAIAQTDITAKANIGSDCTLTVGGDLTSTATAHKDHDVSSSAAAYGDGTLGTAVAISLGDTTVEAKLDGDATVTGDISLSAEITTEQNDAASSATVGTGEWTGKLLTSSAGSLVTGLSSVFSGLFGSLGVNKLTSNNTVNKFGLSAAVTYAGFTNTATARIGADAIVNAGGNITVNATINEVPEASAISYLNSSESYSKRENGASVAFSVCVVDNSAEAYIGAGATVTAGGDVELESANIIPYEIQWHQINELADITDKLNYNLGIQNGFFTSWAEATASAQKTAVGGSVNVTVLTGDSRAYIGSDAHVSAGGAVLVHAVSQNDTVNFVGAPLIAFNASGQTGVGGSIMVIVYENDTIARVDAGAVINAESLLVYADTKVRDIGIGLQGGLADGFGFNGALGWLHVDNRTTAKVAADAQVTLGDGLIQIARDYDRVSGDGTTLFTSAPQFYPNETCTDNDDNTQTRLDAVADTITLPYEHGLTTGQAVYYFSVSGDTIGGLTDATTYYAIVVDSNTLKLATSQANANAGIAIDLTSPSDADSLQSLYPGFDPTASGVVDETTDTIDLGFTHDLITGQPVVYHNGGGTSIGGLTDGETYYVIATGDTTIQLASS